MSDLNVSGEGIEKMMEQLGNLSRGDADDGAEAQLRSALEELKKVREKVAEVGKRAVGKAAKTFMESHPEFASLRWTQYTPYYNDGDACEFGVNDPKVRLRGENDYHDWWDLKYDAKQNNREIPESLVADLGTLHRLFCSAEDAMKATFGDHSQITVDREGNCEVEDLDDHD